MKAGTVRWLWGLLSLSLSLAVACNDTDEPEDTTEQQCLADCGDGCPAPEFWICASDGERYCNECVIECYGLTVADDSSCEDDVDACLEACGEGCPAPEYMICASDGERYCNECLIECHGLTVADDSSCEDDGNACLEACGDGCPAPEHWICASDGERYCNECVIECYGLTVADDGLCGVVNGRNLEPDATEAEKQELVDGNNAFAFELFQKATTGSGNQLLSPYSVSLALAMTYAGARGTTAEQMAHVLHFTLGEERLHGAFNALDLELASRCDEPVEGEPLRLSIANAFWGQEGMNFLDPFLQTVGENYDSEVRSLDFVNETEESRLIINDWVSAKTEERIPELLAPGVLTGDTRAVLTNAIYFKGSWDKPFNEDMTMEAAFHLLDGGEVLVPMMRGYRVESYQYAERPGYKAFELPYEGQDLALMIILPDEGRFNEIETVMTAEELASLEDSLAMTPLEITLPQFTFESEFDMGDTLQEMGMIAPFHGGADFSGMSGVPLSISRVIHKTFISVDERGTEAAAATAVVMDYGAIMEYEEILVDRPFLFLLRDIPTGTVLFLGRVTNPEL